MIITMMTMHGLHPVSVPLSRVAEAGARARGFLKSSEPQALPSELGSVAWWTGSLGFRGGHKGGRNGDDVRKHIDARPFEKDDSEAWRDFGTNR